MDPYREGRTPVVSGVLGEFAVAVYGVARIYECGELASDFRKQCCQHVCAGMGGWWRAAGAEGLALARRDTARAYQRVILERDE